ncbi:Molybdopterin or thiamine biosynthesis adenylyltransferase [Epibacterium ulvae]|uniref:Molybdopterin or thiamine biosynthesis adenylyltransferase n=1 Tax=Epibacterium ulvae TaxID=1156985 RepID=A0A1G5Q1M6_9RHOB|nr:HesA/MoeB/ThiF family protein [Epibacterium ulvae]SCZ55552.1 Molybdopterin or thiamine biosynthesis adenylyltransferase [Epibacterium ulvae]
MSRYARQIAVSEFGPHGQEALRHARLLVIGAGGLAAPVLPYLAAAGVGTIKLADPDIVDLSNLHRQTLFTMDDIGLSKATSAAKHLSARNPECLIETHVAPFDPDTAHDLCNDIDLVLDCADSFAASYIASDICGKRNIPLISASVVEMGGYVGGFCAGAPSLRAVFPDLPRASGTCATLGVLGPIVGIIATLQAQMAISVLTGQSPSPLGQLITFEGTGFRFGGFRFDTAPEPEYRPSFISAQTIDDTDLIIDLRRPEEGPLAHVTAQRRTVEDIAENPPKADAKTRIVLCCRSGLRAWAAAEHLSQQHAGPVALVALGDQSDQHGEHS